MKKNVLLLAVLLMAMVSCKKESVQPSSPADSMETQLADLIQKGDPEAYDAIYTNNSNQKAPKPSVKFLPGVFIILQGDPASGTCFPHTCVCFTIITWPALIGNDPPEPTELELPYTEEFAENGEAELILNVSPSPVTIPNLKFVDVQSVNGSPVIEYTTF